MQGPPAPPLSQLFCIYICRSRLLTRLYVYNNNSKHKSSPRSEESESSSARGALLGERAAAGRAEVSAAWAGRRAAYISQLVSQS